MSPDSEALVARDVRRSIVLGKYISHWGIPSTRQRFQKDDDLVEIYLFEDGAAGKVVRIATAGASARTAKPGSPACEFLMVLPTNLGGATFSEVAGFMMDFVVYARAPDVRIRQDYVTPDSSLLPSAWPTRAILVDVPRGEPEDLETFHVGPEHVHLWWLIPIHKSERELVARNGVSKLEALANDADISLVEVQRPPLA